MRTDYFAVTTIVALSKAIHFRRGEMPAEKMETSRTLKRMCSAAAWITVP